MPDGNLVVIGGSAGAVDVIRRIVARLPHELNAAVCIAIHIAPNSPRALAEMIGGQADIPVNFATDGEAVRHGHVYIAPPDWHLLVDGERLKLTRGPRENGFRPAIDPLFRTAAA